MYIDTDGYCACSLRCPGLVELCLCFVGPFGSFLGNFLVLAQVGDGHVGVPESIDAEDDLEIVLECEEEDAPLKLF